MRSEGKKTEASEPTPPTGSGSNSSLPTPHSSLLTPHCFDTLLTHSIRLAPPWQVSTTDTGTRHARKFGRPRTLDANERLWLVCEHVPGVGEVRVNGTAVGALEAAGPFAADITSLLLPRNEAVFLVASDAPLGGVALEVRAEQ